MRIVTSNFFENFKLLKKRISKNFTDPLNKISLIRFYLNRTKCEKEAIEGSYKQQHTGKS